MTRYEEPWLLSSLLIVNQLQLCPIKSNLANSMLDKLDMSMFIMNFLCHPMSPPPKHGQTFPSAAALGAPPRAFCSASVMASASGSGSAGCGLLTLEMTS